MFSHIGSPTKIFTPTPDSCYRKPLVVEVNQEPIQRSDPDQDNQPPQTHVVKEEPANTDFEKRLITIEDSISGLETSVKSLLVLNRSNQAFTDFLRSDLEKLSTRLDKIERGKMLNSVGVAVVVLAFDPENKVLMGKRKNSYGSEEWAFPGGMLELNEEWIQCARREMLEETGLELINPEYLCTVNSHRNNDKHYVLIVIKGKVEGEAKLLEPEKCYEWSWCNWGEFLEPSFLSVQQIEKATRNLINFN